MNLNDLPQTAMIFIVAAAVFVAGFLVLAGLESSTLIDDGCASTTSTEEAAVNNITEGLTSVIEYAPVWGVIIGVAVLLGIVIAGFMFARGRGYI